MDIAAEHFGYETTAMIENDPFCQKVLVKRFPRAKILGDIKEVTGNQLLQLVADRRSGGDANGSLPTIDLMSGGFP